MDYKTILGLSIVLSIHITSVAAAQRTTLDDVYEASENKETLDDLKCEQIEGSLRGCSECFECDHDQVKAGKNIVKLKVNDAKCQSSVTVCCKPQRDLRYREKDEDPFCGIRNPDGYPRLLRKELRSVLQGEYPWRVWIYKDLDTEVLCAGTYIDKRSKLVMTTASCVDGIAPSYLQVRFDKNFTRSRGPIAVLKVEIHEDYNEDNHLNDIAVLSLESVPKHSLRACVPIEPALHGIPCVAVSADDIYIDQSLPQQINCVADGDEPLDPSLMCVLGRKDAQKPEPGSGMVCVDEMSEEDTFTVYGIYLHQSDDNKVAVGTNVTHHSRWIKDKIASMKYY